MNVKVSQAQIQSIQAKINKIAKESGATSQQIMTLFLLERAAVRLLNDERLQSHLVFKGGYVGVRVYGSPRYTTDLDAIILGISKEKAIEWIKSAMAVDADDAIWFQYESSAELTTQGDYGGYGLVFRGGLGNPPAKLSRAQLIHIDLGIGDPVTPSPRQVSTSFTIGEGSLTWLVYPVETILAEKLHAMVVLGDRNSRSKDVYDIHLFLPKANPETLKEALKSTFAFRGDQQPETIFKVLLTIDTSILKRGWATATATIKGSPKFETSFENIVDILQKWGI